MAVVPDGEPVRLAGSGKEPLDRAAVSSIRASNPFEPLPPAFSGPYIELRFTYYYNLAARLRTLVKLARQQVLGSLLAGPIRADLPVRPRAPSPVPMSPGKSLSSAQPFLAVRR